MGDIFDRVVSQQDIFKKILSKLPGFKGYFERSDRRAADKLLREVISDRYQAQWTRLSGIQRDLVSAGKLELLDDIEIASTKLRTFIDKVKTAAYGYAGFFDAVKVNEDELTQVYQYDLSLLTLIDSVTSAVDNLEASIDTDGMPAAIRNLIQKSQDSLDAFNKRSEVMKLGQ
jgi:DNA-directed RNA polymerase beta' subunit